MGDQGGSFLSSREVSWILQSEEFTGRRVGAAVQAEGCPHRHVTAYERVRQPMKREGGCRWSQEGGQVGGLWRGQAWGNGVQ